ncbi:hypothetical protein KSP35_22810 [Aquihabitans sp. G128]|uniref:hypothetical protein n=1 Tax=Aquihabitans sp. G128 TaxID=2849779 RepID=UPI001C22B9D4|nr:hypothetical protein [Aquihabitans sp. G128]QXC61109.1 hypothetical protein KSP35_22810 [Aquihabitans sp. G128]
MSDASDLDDLGEPDEDRLVETGERLAAVPEPDAERAVEVAAERGEPVPDGERLVEPTDDAEG